MITLEAYFDYVILPILAISVMLVFIRLFKGPAVVDRVVALDLIITTGIGIITVYSIRSNQEVFLDVAIILALIAFLGTVAFAYCIVRQKDDCYCISPFKYGRRTFDFICICRHIAHARFLFTLVRNGESLHLGSRFITHLRRHHVPRCIGDYQRYCYYFLFDYYRSYRCSCDW